MLFYLPYFINQLLLLLSSGMVLQEAMKTIALNYKNIEYEKENAFVKAYIGVYEDSQGTGKNIIRVFNEFSKNSQIKELSRIGGILIDSDKRGINVWQKLTEEREYLWQQKMFKEYLPMELVYISIRIGYKNWVIPRLILFLHIN